MAERHSWFYFWQFREEILKLRRFSEQVELSGHEHLVSVILQQSESDFLPMLNQVNVNHASSVNGLTALHFAVGCPRALEYLIRMGINANVEDHYGRRPIHLAVALGSSEAVNLLLQADCASATPWDTSLLQETLQLQDPEKDIIINFIVKALIDRHERLLSHARTVLTEEELSSLGISGFTKLERRAPDIRNAILSHGFQLPEALDLDDKGVYDTTCMQGSIRMTPRIAETLWQAGFNDIYSADEERLSPILQSWYAANFEMVALFIHTKRCERIFAP